MKTTNGLIAIAGAALLCGCAINETVSPVAVPNITSLCIHRNVQVFMPDFVGELKSQLEGKGMKARIYDGDMPTDCRYRIEYTANWQWDLAMYLSYANLRVFDNENRLLGEASYDARFGGGRLDKFGHTAEKLRPLLDRLFPRHG
jgi:hypothetical protein